MRGVLVHKKGTEKQRKMREKKAAAFLKSFPVTLAGQPPNKKQTVEAGFSNNRVFYDKWRALQYAKREEHLLCK